MDKARIAVIGCGAVATLSHLPALASAEHATIGALVDRDLGRARRLAARYGVDVVAEDARAVIGRVDGAILAVPNFLHAAIATELLEAGVPVLVEKPLARYPAECDRMLEAARASGAVLATGLEFRFFDGARLAKAVIEAGLLGALRAFDLRQGVVSEWPFETDYIYRRDAAGGGVLLDFGSHMLDLLLWWLGDFDEIAYCDNARGGVEADAEVRLRRASGLAGTVELSRVRNLRNSFVVTGERATLEVELWNPDGAVRLRPAAGGEQILAGFGRGPERRPLSATEVYRRMIDDFALAIRGARPAFVPGSEGRRAVDLIARCYACRQKLDEPWVFPDGEAGRALRAHAA